MDTEDLKVDLAVCRTALRDIVSAVEGSADRVFVHGLVHKIASAALCETGGLSWKGEVDAAIQRTDHTG